MRTDVEAMLRALRHYWRINLAVVVAAAVNTAVLTGALLVGDSVRGSLRDLTLERLGDIDLALVAERFFRQELAAELAASPDFEAGFDDAAPAILLRGTAVHADSRARASHVDVHGVDDRFIALFRQSAAGPEAASAQLDPERHLERRPGQVFPSVVINEALGRELGANVGDAVLLYFRLGSDVPSETLLGSRDPEDLVGAVRCIVTAVIADRGLGRFGLSPHQSFPLNAFLSLEALQRALDEPGMANAVFVSRRPGSGADPQAMLRRALGPADLGLQIDRTRNVLAVESREFVLRPAVVEAIDRAAADLGARGLRIQTYLANTMEVGDRLLPYSTVSALGALGAAAGETGATADPGAATGRPGARGPEPGVTSEPEAAGEPVAEADGPAGVSPAPPTQASATLQLLDGSPAPPLADDDILLNEWAAADLGAAAGDTLRMSYYVVGPYERLEVESHDFRVSGVVAMRGLAADPSLTPDYPGIEGADDIAMWDPPFPVDLALVRPQDEAYWDEHRGTPKAFVSDETARRLWSTRYGSTTAVRLAVPSGDDPEGFERRLVERLRSEVDLPLFGLRFLDVKAEGLEAASGATDFGGLFIGFSFFLIVSSALLVGLLFSLGVQQRAREVGLRLAVGFPQRTVRRQLLAEGGTLAFCGAALGLAGGVVYGWLLMVGLRTLWLPAVGSPLLFLHVVPASLAIGAVASVLVVLASIGLTVRRLGRVSATSLLRGSFSTSPAATRRAARRARALALASGGLAVALFAFALVTGQTTSPGLAMGIGALLLLCGLTGFALWCRTARGGLAAGRLAALGSMAARNSAWNPGRSILSVALVASATFVIVAVAANRRDPVYAAGTIESGGGGFELMATSDLPIHHDLESPEARFELGFPPQAEETLAGIDVVALRLLPGDDASCLNLYRPQKPAVLGVPVEMIERGGFEFAATVRNESNPWRLLEMPTEPGVIPAFGDANSVQWILHLGLGEELALEDEHGQTVRLRLVGLLRESVFQSQLLISEHRLLEHFPNRSGYSSFLIDVPEAGTGEIADSVAIDGESDPSAAGAGASDPSAAGNEQVDTDETRADEVAAVLEAELGRFGFDAVRTDEKLAGFLAVQNTYLSTFQMLGGLGLLLGTLGLGIVLVRNVIERRAELATLRAFGFRRASLTAMVLAENAFLLLAGTLIGSLSALVAVAPRYLTGGLHPPAGSVLSTLALVLLVGMLSSAAAVAGALRVPLLPVLKADR